MSADSAGFADDLAKAFDEVEDTSEPEEANQDTEPDVEPQAEPAEPEGSSDAEPDSEPDTEPDTEADLEPEPISAPEHWSQEDKDQFAGLPDDIKPLYLDKVKSIESGYNRKFEDLANDRKSLDPYRALADALEPYKQQMDLQGLTPERYVGQLMAIGEQMRAKPEETIRWLAQTYGVDLAKPDEGGGVDEYADPQLTALEQRVSQLQTQLSQSQTNQQQASQDYVERQWQAFVGASGEDGKTLYPGADRLRSVISVKLTTLPDVPGETPQQAFKRAYDEVKWADPEIRQSLMEAERKAELAKTQEAEREKARKADVQKAKKVGRQVKSSGKPTSEAPKQSKDWKEELERQFDQASA